MTEAYAIKPCPFCGAEAEIVRQGTTRQSMQIACTNCNTQVESGDVIGLTPPEKWHWNNRHPVTVSENTTPVCPNCGATSWADFYRGSSVIASVCKKCDHKITPPVTAVSEKGEADALLKEAREDLFRLGGDSAMAYEHGDSVSRKEANDEASAIHARIDAYFSRRQG